METNSSLEKPNLNVEIIITPFLESRIELRIEFVARILLDLEYARKIEQ